MKIKSKINTYEIKLPHYLILKNKKYKALIHQIRTYKIIIDFL